MIKVKIAILSAQMPENAISELKRTATKHSDNKFNELEYSKLCQVFSILKFCIGHVVFLIKLNYRIKLVHW